MTIAARAVMLLVLSPCIAGCRPSHVTENEGAAAPAPDAPQESAAKASDDPDPDPAGPAAEEKKPSASWDSAFGGEQDDRAYGLLVTADGGLVVAGVTASRGAGERDAWVFKLDGKGSVVWDRTYGGKRNDEAYAIAAASGDGFVVAGTTESSGKGARDGWIFRIDGSGKLLWERTFGGPYWDELRSIQQTEDGGFVAAGYTEPAGAGAHFALVVRTDRSGHPLWEQTLKRSQWDDAQAVVQKPGGGFVAAGYTEAAGTSLTHDALLAGLGSDGTPMLFTQASR
jgi:hypothetical protein